jgi:hypothetical protein
MLSINAAIVLAMLISPAHAEEQNAAVQTDAAPIENPPLPRPKPSLFDATGDNPAALVSAFRHQHGEVSVEMFAAEQALEIVRAGARPRISTGGYRRASNGTWQSSIRTQIAMRSWVLDRGCVRATTSGAHDVK